MNVSFAQFRKEARYSLCAGICSECFRTLEHDDKVYMHKATHEVLGCGHCIARIMSDDDTLDIEAACKCRNTDCGGKKVRYAEYIYLNRYTGNIIACENCADSYHMFEYAYMTYNNAISS